jgi:hypothetical protein
MAEKQTLQYDREADILYIGKREPYAEQESEEISDEVVARLKSATEEVESLEAMFFSTRPLRNDILELPAVAGLHLAAEV